MQRKIFFFKPKIGNFFEPEFFSAILEGDRFRVSRFRLRSGVVQERVVEARRRRQRRRRRRPVGVATVDVVECRPVLKEVPELILRYLTVEVIRAVVVV